MEELLENQSASQSHTILDLFQQAHLMCWLDSKDAYGEDHGHKYVQLEERRIDALGKMGSFRKSAIALCDLSDNLLLIEADEEKAARLLNRARKIGTSHGFVEVESRACQGLGQMAFREWREEDAVELLRHALKLRGGMALLTRATIDDERDSIHDLNLLETFIHALLRTNALKEVAPLIQRYREAAKAESRRRGLNGQLCYHELLSLRASALLHTVSYNLIPSQCSPLLFHASLFHTARRISPQPRTRFQQSLLDTKALGESRSALNFKHQISTLTSVWILHRHP